MSDVSPELFSLVCSERDAALKRISELEDGLRVLLENNERLTKAVSEAPEFERAVHAAMAEEPARLRAALREVCDLYDAAECVGPTRSERARVAELRQLTD